jgi:hypothetical protein
VTIRRGIREFEARELERVSARFDAFVDGLSDYYERRRREGA